MVSKSVSCKNCKASINVSTWRKFVKCPYCDEIIPFEGFDYRTIDWHSSMYAGVKRWADCPACRSENMYLGASGNAWKCPDCGYVISKQELKTGVLWFCDDCETFLNVQPGFTTENDTWKCKECGFVNNVSKNNII